MQNIKVSTLLNWLKSNKHRLTISIVWILGLIIGKCFAQHHPWNTVNAEIILNSVLSYPSGVLITIFTMLIGYLSCIVSRHLLYIILFLKAFSYALVATNVAIAFGSIGWLMRILLMSTDTLLIAVLLLFSFKSAGERFDTIMRNIAIFTIIMSVIISVDFYFIIPFTSSLLNC